MSPTGKSDSFRSCVRASEAVRARERAFLQPLAWANSRCCPALVLWQSFTGVLRNGLKTPGIRGGFKRCPLKPLVYVGVLRDTFPFDSLSAAGWSYRYNIIYQHKS